MLTLRPLLAGVGPLFDPGVTPPSSNGGGSFWHSEFVLFVGGGLLFAVVLFLIVFLAKSRASRGVVSRSPKTVYRDSDNSPATSSRRVRIRKKRAGHPDNRRRNPTLGETGGLPPLRPEEPSEPIS